MKIRNERWIGQNVARREDKPLLMGRARFTDDVILPRMAHAAVLASPYAHARIVSIDKSRAEALPGVHCVLTGAEAAELCGPLPTFSSVPIQQYCIAVEKVRHVGEPVAAVVADTRYIAEDALALIEVEYEELPVIHDIRSALDAEGDAILHAGLGSNVFAHRHFKWGPVDTAFEEAAHVVSRRFKWPRVGPQPMETSAAIADYDPARDSFTIWCNMSMASMLGAFIAMSLGVDQSRINFPTLYCGGSFGGKNALTHLACLTALLSKACGRPVKFIEDRLEHLANGNQHASDREYDAALAIDADGRFLGLRLKVEDDYGAYFSVGLGSHGNALSQATGSYQIAALEYEVTAVASNKTQQAPYRGFGGEVGNFVIERLVDAAAVELGVDRLELRRRNFVRKDQFPYRLPHGNIYDSGDYHSVLEKALTLAELPRFEEMKAEARRNNKRIGIGIATVNERSVLSVTELWMLEEKPLFPMTSTPESVRISIDMMGAIQTMVFAPHWGNSPETMAIQLVAENLSTTPDRVNVVYGDTDGGLVSFGPAGSRTTVMLAGAIAGACKILKKKIRAIAAHQFGVEPDEILIHSNFAYVAADPDRRFSFAEIATTARNFRMSLPADEIFQTGLSADFTYDHPFATAPAADGSDFGVFYPIVGHACHIAVVEVDLATHGTRFLRYVAVHDAGTIVNPKLVDGQIRGGVAQGIGTALYEQYHYDEDGQLLTGSLADYLVPTASEIPDLIIGHYETPSPYTEFGIKGCAEGGRLAAMPAIASAVEDAFKDEDLFIDTLPLTPANLYGMRRRSPPNQSKGDVSWN